MGNAVSLTCEKCLYSNEIKLDISKNTNVNNSAHKYYDNSTHNSQINYENININGGFKKTIHNYFSRNSIPENSIQFTINSTLNNHTINKRFTFNKNDNDHFVKLNNNKYLNLNDSFISRNNNTNFFDSRIKNTNSIIDDKILEEDSKEKKEREIVFQIFKSKTPNSPEDQKETLIMNQEEFNQRINSIGKSKTNLLGSPVKNQKKKPFLDDTIVKDKLLLNSIVEENSKSKIQNTNFLSINSTEKDDIKVSEETPDNILHSFTNLKNKNIRGRRTSVSSIFSELENVIISQHPKGYFLYKSKNYKFYGEKDINGLKQGFGIVKWSDKSELKSIFTNNKINTYAIFIDYNVDYSIYCGKYKDNYPKGYGYYVKDNVVTEGDGWLKNHMNGIGMQVFYSDDHFYQGEFYKSAKSGIGLYRWSDGSVCLGEWNDDKLNGYGLIKYSNDNVYIGQFKDNLMDGWGEFLWNDRKYYIGEYKDGIKHGFGIYVSDFKKLDCYIGFWEYGKVSGLGVKIDGDNLKIGVWKDGRRINWIKNWEMKDYVKPSKIGFLKFLKLDLKSLQKFVLKCQKHEIFHEKFLTIIKI